MDQKYKFVEIEETIVKHTPSCQFTDEGHNTIQHKTLADLADN